jgi:DNA polymerase-3 subunit gamma/tau
MAVGATGTGDGGTRSQPAAAGQPAVAQPAASPATAKLPESFLEVIELADKQGDLILRTNLFRHVHLVRFETGRIELRPADQAPSSLANRLGQRLTEWTGRRWVISISSEPGQPTLEQEANARADGARAEILAHPLVKAALEAFPGSTIDAVRDLTPALTPGVAEADGAVAGEQETPEESA